MNQTTRSNATPDEHGAVATRMSRIQSSAVRDLLKYSKRADIISLAGGIPAPDLFDMDGLHAALSLAVGQGGTGVFQYGETEGASDLRAAIAVLLAERGVTAAADNILVTTGSQQALDLAARVLLDKDDVVLLERPSYLAALQTFGLAEAQVVTAPSSSDGMDVDWVSRYLETHRVKAIYLVPNFGNPTGATMPYERRRQLVEAAARSGTHILEDDPYGALRFAGSQIPSLHQIACERGLSDLVIYISSFSKILAPGLRIGWMVLPDTLHRQAALAKQSIDLHSCSLSQALIVHYLASCRLSDRMAVLRQGYRERRDALVDALKRHLGASIEFSVPDGGMFLWARFAPHVDAAHVLQVAVTQGVIFVPGAAFHASDPERNTFRLSYSMIRPDTADESAARLARALAIAYPSA